jgi:medium-chain acyl-[acyl-carrier-protein] hydrolase
MTKLQTKHSPWLLPLKHSAASSLSVFCFPYAGAGASVYRSWNKLFTPDMNLYAIQAPGRETRFSEDFVGSIPELASTVAKEILNTTDKPIVLFGHSLGAACAYETARALEHTGRSPELLILSGRQGPGSISKRAPIAHLSDTEFLQHVLTYKGTPAAVLENEELMELLLPLLRADFSLAEQYKPRPEPLLTCPVLGLGSTQDEWLDHESLERWGDLTLGSFESHWFEGDHFYLNHRTEELVSYVQKRITAQMKTGTRPSMSV